MAGPAPQVKPLPFKEAVAQFERRGGQMVATDRWTDLWQQEHAVAFTVARSAGYDILGDIHAELRKALAEGETFESFAKNLRPILQKKGWWGKVQRADGELVQLGSMRRLRTIFDVNLRVSYSAGAWERAQRTKRALPYIVYDGVRDGRQRPAHREWTGTCLPIDDPWWDTHWCPCGWRCRCWNRQVTRLEARRIGVTRTPPSGPPRRFFNPSTGATVEVPYGIDPGFGYNVGKAALAGRSGEIAARTMADKLAATAPRVAALPLPAPILADQTAEFSRWVQGIDRAKPKGELRVAGALPKAVLDYLARPEIGLSPQSGAITVTDHAIAHMMRDAKATMRPALASLLRLPTLLASPEAILWDRTKQNFVWVVEIAGETGTRFVIEIDRSVIARDDDGKRQTIRTNAIVNGQVIGFDALRDPTRYAVVTGRWL